MVTETGSGKPNRWNEVPKRSKTEVRVSAAEKQKHALDLRLKGYSYQEIADEVGYKSKGAAHTAVAKGLRDIPREKAEEAREAELSRLDTMQKAVMNQALAGDPLAVDRVLKVVEARSKLLGLYDLAQEVDPGAEKARQALNDFLASAIEKASPGATE